MHAGRVAYLVPGENVIEEPAYLTAAGGGCPMTGAVPPASAGAAPHASPAAEPRCASIRFGRMFPPRWGAGKSREELGKVRESLAALGRCMNNPQGCHAEDVGGQMESDIPAGYTYLGQFITHEITFDKTEGLPLSQLKSENARSPSLDLDSLYGARPDGGGQESGAGPDDEKWKELYEVERPARLRVGTTQSRSDTFPWTFENDLPRGEGGAAVIGDERNDENLALAQTHVAFIKFHNRVVEDLESGRYKDCKGSGRCEDREPPPAERLFDEARAEVVRHFQWVILKDYLPRLVDEELVEAITRRPERYRPACRDDLFIPLEFSAAAFRIGHSMVRQRYMWNRMHPTNVALKQLFTHTKRSGNLGGLERLDNTWVIDWKRFYDFTPFAADYPYPYDPRPYYPYPYDPQQSYNKAGRVDTVFDLHLDDIVGFNHGGLPAGEQAITVRNLLRGLALGLPWGEDVADALGEKRLEPRVLRARTHSELLDAEPFEGKTPLWYYILEEAKLQGNGGKLGRVGGRIVAETLVGLIRHSRYSILRKARGADEEWELSDWRPAYGRPSARAERFRFEMTDLLRAADVVDPLGRRLHRVYAAEPQH